MLYGKVCKWCINVDVYMMRWKGALMIIQCKHWWQYVNVSCRARRSFSSHASKTACIWGAAALWTPLLQSPQPWSHRPGQRSRHWPQHWREVQPRRADHSHLRLRDLTVHPLHSVQGETALLDFRCYSRRLRWHVKCLFVSVKDHVQRQNSETSKEPIHCCQIRKHEEENKYEHTHTTWTSHYI